MAFASSAAGCAAGVDDEAGGIGIVMDGIVFSCAIAAVALNNATRLQI
jgi:hypothetical protein